MIHKTHATREVMRETERYVQHNDGSTHMRIFNVHQSTAGDGAANTLHYIHLFNPILTDTIDQLMVQKLGPAHFNDAGEKKWNAINNITVTTGNLLISLTKGNITINYTGHNQHSLYIVDLLKAIVNDIDDQLQPS